MLDIIPKIVVLAFTLLALDTIYIGLNRQFIFSQIQSVQNTAIVFRYIPAILCYILLLFGLYYFILRTNTTASTIYDKIRDAFLLGIIIYGVYETTCYATFKNWTMKMLVMDTLWGGILLATTTFIFLSMFPK